MKLHRLELRILSIVIICGVLAALLVIQSGTLVRSCYAIGPFGRSSDSVRDFRASSFGAGDLPGYRPVGQSGALGSSSFNIRHGGAAPPLAGAGRVPAADRSVRYASPMTPMRISGGGGGGSARATFAPTSAYHSTNQVQSLAISLATDRRELLKDPKREIKTLVPRIPGKYRTEMALGEQASVQAGEVQKSSISFRNRRSPFGKRSRTSACTFPYALRNGRGLVLAPGQILDPDTGGFSSTTASPRKAQGFLRKGCRLRERLSET